MRRVGLAGVTALLACRPGSPGEGERPPLHLRAAPAEARAHAPSSAEPASPEITPSCAPASSVPVGEHTVSVLADGSLWFRAGLAIDADGSPRAYHPDDEGLDFLANAGRPGNWWALVVDGEGEPIVQGPDDPAPGYYVSTTSLIDRRRPEADPRRYVDAEAVPFVVLPPELRVGEQATGVELGDLALVVDLESGARSFAIFADVGPRRSIGEGSMALADALGLPSNPRRGGKAGGLAYLIWPGSGEGVPLTPTKIAARGAAELRDWGGEARLERCLSDP